MILLRIEHLNSGSNDMRPFVGFYRFLKFKKSPAAKPELLQI